MTNMDVLELISPAAGLVAAPASGSCMEPAISNGDIMLIDTRCDVRRGDVIAFEYAGNRYCKYYYPQKDGSVVMQPSDLRHYKSMKLSMGDVVIIGKVVSVIHEMPSRPIQAAEPEERLPAGSGNGTCNLVWTKEDGWLI